MRIIDMYNILLDSYGAQRWWPADTPWEMAVGALLTQNTNWRNVERAISGLKKANLLDSPQSLLKTPPDTLGGFIRPSGYYRMKAARLVNLAEWWIENTRDNRPLLAPAECRNSLLRVKGVGPETADSILLYGFGIPVFVIDSYTFRTMERHADIKPGLTYHELQELVTKALPEDSEIFNEFHALIVANAKNGCLKSACTENCALNPKFS